jgi:phage replication O-like protein O
MRALDYDENSLRHPGHDNKLLPTIFVDERCKKAPCRILPVARLVQLSRCAGLYGRGGFMPDMMSQRFVRVPTDLLEAALRLHLNGTQWRIFFWVVRQTLGWNRPTTLFSWYRIARELSADRGGVVRCGRGLLHSGILYLDGKQIGIRLDSTCWATLGGRSTSRPTMTVGNDAACPPKAVADVIASGDARLLERGQESSLFRRTKDSGKDRSKTFKEKEMGNDLRQRFQHGAFSEHHPACEARTIPGKYDRVSQD